MPQLSFQIGYNISWDSQHNDKRTTRIRGSASVAWLQTRQASAVDAFWNGFQLGGIHVRLRHGLVNLAQLELVSGEAGRKMDAHHVITIKGLLGEGPGSIRLIYQGATESLTVAGRRVENFEDKRERERETRDLESSHGFRNFLQFKSFCDPRQK